MNTSTVWQNCLTHIKNRVASQTFQTWFAPLKVASVENSELTLQVPSQFYYEWLDSHYRPLIMDAIKQTTGKEFQVKYSVVLGEVETEPPPSLPTEQEAKNGFSKLSQLNNRYTFDNFVEGAGN